MRIVLGLLAAVLLLIPQASFAQRTKPIVVPPRIFVDVNLFGTADSLARDRVFTARFLKFGEMATSRATYPRPAGTSGFPVDVAGAFMVKPWIGVGVGYSRTQFEDTVGLEAVVPHPALFNANGTGVGVTDQALIRKEAAINIFLAVVPVRTDRLRIRLMGGPAFFSYTADMVHEVLYAQAFDPFSPQNAITVNGFASTEATGRRVGAHAGADVSYFFSRLVGVGAGVRFGFATVSLEEEPLSQISQDIRVGGTVVFLGVRVRAGGSSRPF
jgi:hypothetical protein